MNNRRSAGAALCAALWIVLGAGCSQAGEPRRFGSPIDPKAPKVTLAQLIAKPDVYEGKDVVVEGQFGGACGDGDMFFKDKFDMIEADPPTSKVIGLKKGTKIRLFGLVKVRRTSGAKEDEKAEAGEKKNAEHKMRGAKEAKGEVYVRIVGKGVEVIK